jgi:putative flippase GtrA
MNHELLRKIRFYEFIRFSIAGGVSFIVDYSILVLLTDGFKIFYLTSSGISFSMSVIINYIICVKWVFKETKVQSIRAIISFFIISLIGLSLNQFLMWFSVEIILVSYKIAKVIATGLSMIWNYFMKRKVIIM